MVSVSEKIKVNKVRAAEDIGSQIANHGAAKNLTQGAVVDGMSEMLQEITIEEWARDAIKSRLTPEAEDVADAAHRSALPEIQQPADRLGRTRVAADFARDCERGILSDGRTHPHIADDEAGLQLLVKV
jgi:hypothetical protein